MPSIDVTFEVVTPAYAGGADRAKTDGLRPPTLKSLLRFWWRAMHPDLTGAALFDEEARIFGAPRYSDGTPCGQGIRVVPVGQQFATATHVYQWNDTPPLFYMVYGADRHKDDPEGPWINNQRVEPGGWFRFRMYPSPAMSATDWAEVKQATVLLSCFGGFGGRSRRGWGSLQLSSYAEQQHSGGSQRDSEPMEAEDTYWPNFAQCHDRRAVVAELKKVLNGLPTATGHSGTPQHTAISSALRVVAGPLSNTWEQALVASGQVFYDLRRLYGARVIQRNNAWVKAHWGPDFDRVNGWRTGSVASGSPAPLGSAFGLPHNYQFRGGNNRKPSIEAFGINNAGNPDPEQQARRASDVLFKVLAVGNPRRYCPLVLWMPSLFLPTDILTTFKRGELLVRLATPATTAIGQLFNGRTTVRVTTPHGTEEIPFEGYGTRAGWQVVWP